jgi:hypothetical protein
VVFQRFEVFEGFSISQIRSAREYDNGVNFAIGTAFQFSNCPNTQKHREIARDIPEKT